MSAKQWFDSPFPLLILVVVLMLIVIIKPSIDPRWLAGICFGWVLAMLVIGIPAGMFKSVKSILPVMVLIALPAPSLAQQPQPLQIASNCVKGIYDECEFVPPHWYYRVGAVWTRDDGVVGKPPVVVTGTCTVAVASESEYWQRFNDISPEPVKAGLRIGQAGRKIEPSLKRPDLFRFGAQDSPWNLNAKLSIFAFAATASLDCWSTGNLRENNPLLRNSHGGVNRAACGAINGTALGLTVLLQKNHPKVANLFRWVGAGGHLVAFAHNEAVKR